MSAYVEIEKFLNPEVIETAYRKAVQSQEKGRQSFADAGFRAALARDPKLLKALEKATEIVDRMAEEQYGRTRRDMGNSFGMTLVPTEVQLWREAYKTCDKGEPIRNLEWIYGAAAWLCGYVD